jgi:hypothetical protein
MIKTNAMVGIPLQPKGPRFEPFLSKLSFLFMNEMDENKFVKQKGVQIAP